MSNFYKHTIKRPKTMIVIFVLLALAGAVIQQLVDVNYDINDYLPEDSRSTISIDVMNEEFDGGIPNCRVMIENVTIPEALEYKKRFEETEGVTDVTWLDDSFDLTQPLEMQDQEAVESYYKDNTALYSITIEESHILDGVDAVREIIGDDNSMCGSAVSTAVATESTVSEILRISLFAVLFVIIVLILTTNSWIEPVIILAGIGIAILINSGTNIIFGEISFISNSAGAILQLAVSLDYSVFLLHRFEECRKEYDTPQEAMVSALCKSTGSIMSSGLTTVIGFVALCLMRFRIGPDLGLVLAKGVAISLISVFIFMPSLILKTYRIIDKTRHKRLVPQFKLFAKVVTKIMIPFACVFAVIVVPCFLASNSNSFYYGDSHIFGENTKLGSDTSKIEKVFGKSDTYVLLVPKGDHETQLALSDELKNLPQVKDIISYVDTVGSEIPQEYLDADTLSMLESENYSRMVLQIDTDYEGEETFALVNDIRKTAQDFYYDNYYLAGNGVSTYDLMNTVTADMAKVNFIAIGAVFVVLLLTMKSITIPIILVLSIETAIWLNLTFPYFADSSIFYLAYLIISSIQLGATVDYAILLTDRYIEYRHEMPKKQAIRDTVSSVAVSIMTSGSVLTVVGYLMGYFSTHGLLAQLGIFIGRGTVCSLAIVLFVLPALLYIFDGLIQKTTKKLDFYKERV
ncbi:MAG: MMPL family transporter [Clostridium sp.]|nr:MMPL family transporter [Clostridium sp.]